MPCSAVLEPDPANVSPPAPSELANSAGRGRGRSPAGGWGSLPGSWVLLLAGSCDGQRPAVAVPWTPRAPAPREQECGCERWRVHVTQMEMVCARSHTAPACPGARPTPPGADPGRWLRLLLQGSGQDTAPLSTSGNYGPGREITVHSPPRSTEIVSFPLAPHATSSDLLSVLTGFWL